MDKYTGNREVDRDLGVAQVHQIESHWPDPVIAGHMITTADSTKDGVRLCVMLQVQVLTTLYHFYYFAMTQITEDVGLGLVPGVPLVRGVAATTGDGRDLALQLTGKG